MVHQISCLLLLLICLAGFYGSETEQGSTTVDTTYGDVLLSVQTLPTDGPSSVVIGGVDVVTLGIVYGFQCSASCYPACNFTWTWGNVTSQGPEMSLKLTQLQAAQNLTCTAVNPVTGGSVTAHKTLQVAAGPSNIQVSGPEFLLAAVTSIFTCTAECYPSCNYTWSLVSEGIAFIIAQGNSAFITPLPGTLFASLTCKAQNTLSHLYISTTLPLWVPDGPSSVVIGGVDVVTLGILYAFQCSASCYPACNFTWTWGNVTSQGPEMSLKLTQLQAAQNLTCTAVNPVTGGSVTAHKTLQVTAAPSNIQISGPEFLLPGVASIFTCAADCYHSCNYTWILISQSIAFSIVQGNSVSITPLPSTLTVSVTCKAQDTRSHLYISTTLPLWVAWPDGGPATHPKETSAVLLLASIISAALTL